MKTLAQLKNKHKDALRSGTHGNRTLLSSVIKPVMVRLNEEKHLTIVADEVPMSVPGSPQQGLLNYYLYIFCWA